MEEQDERYPTFKRLTLLLMDCPFCGGKAGFDVFLSPDKPSHFKVSCCFCGANMKHDRSDKVIGIWNHRGLITDRS